MDQQRKRWSIAFASDGGSIMPPCKDAKAMAKSLRDSLAARSVSLSHSECLEIVAKQSGFADWNTLSGKLDLESRSVSRPEDLMSTLQPAILDGTCQVPQSAGP